MEQSQDYEWIEPYTLQAAERLANLSSEWKLNFLILLAKHLNSLVMWRAYPKKGSERKRMTASEQAELLSMFIRLQRTVLFKAFDFHISKQPAHYKDVDFFKTLFGRRLRRCANDVRFAIESAFH